MNFAPLRRGGIILALALMLFLAACVGGPNPGLDASTPLPVQFTPAVTETLEPIMLVPPARPVLTEASPATPEENPSAAASPQQVPADTPSAAPQPPTAAIPATATLGPTSTQPPAHPLVIESLRKRNYPGSDIVLEQELTPGSNYKRYYASYKSDRLKLYGLLAIPDGEMPSSGWPVIVFNHGYIPPDEYRTTERYVAYLDLIARSGYIVFKPDYRGHDRSEGEARGAYGYPDYVIDVLNAVASLKRLPEADPQRIGMWGHSMGGYIALRAMVISKDIKVGVIWAGVVASYPDLLDIWIQWLDQEPLPPANANSWQDLTRVYGTPQENPAFWASISANSYLADLSGPLQLHHGTADIEVPVEFSETLYDQIQKAGKTAELYTYDGDNHNISNYFNLAMQRTIAYFDRYLKTP